MHLLSAMPSLACTLLSVCVYTYLLMWPPLTGTDSDCADPFDGVELAVFSTDSFDASGCGPRLLYAHSPFCSAPFAGTDMRPSDRRSTSLTFSLFTVAIHLAREAKRTTGRRVVWADKLFAKQQQVPANQGC